MEPSLASFLAVAFVSLVAVISPGPDFFIVFKNSLVYSRRAGYLTALGVCMALTVHLTYTIVGIGVLIAESPLLYGIVKYSGVAYLFYIGAKGLASSFKPIQAPTIECVKSQAQLADSHAFMQGFWTNLLNPKAAVFFVSLFSQFIDAGTPTAVAIAYGAINWLIALGWFLLLSYVLTHRSVAGRVDQFRVYIDRVMGGVLMMLGAKLLFV